MAALFFMGLQSLTFYVLLAWLPDILIDRGYDTDFAGWMLSLSQATGILGALVVPFWAGFRKDQRLVIVLLVLLEVICLGGLMLPQIGMVVVWVSILGLVLGGTFGLALLLLVLRSSNSETAAELSGMVQSIGYFIPATGPLFIGPIQDITRIWNNSLGVLIILSLLKFWAGMGAGKPGNFKPPHFTIPQDVRQQWENSYLNVYHRNLHQIDCLGGEVL